MNKFRSPVLGYNHNVRHRGWLFHVQTEDSGIQNPHLYTHLFHEGVIITTKKMVYDPGADSEVIKALMQAQHKSVLRELKNGKFDDKIDRYLGAAPGSEGASSPAVAVEPTLEQVPPPDVEISSPRLAGESTQPPIALEMIADVPGEGEAGIPEPMQELATSATQGMPAALLVDLGIRDTLRPSTLAAAADPENAITLREGVPASVLAGTSVPTSFDGPVPAAVDWAESERIDLPLPPPPNAVAGSWEITEPAAADSRPPGSYVAFRPPAETRVREPARDDPPPAVPPRPTPPAGISTSFVARPGQKERPFEKSGKYPTVNLPEGADRQAVPQPVARSDSTTYSHTRRKSVPPGEFVAAPRTQGRGNAPAPARQTSRTTPTPGSVPAQPRQTGQPRAAQQPAQRQTGGAAPAKPVQHPWISSPPAPPARQTGGKVNQTIFSPGAPPPRPPTPVPGGPRSANTPPGVVARPAVIIGQPPTPIGAPQPVQPQQTRRQARESSKPADSIFGQDRLSEKSLDEVILAYLSEDSKEE